MITRTYTTTENLGIFLGNSIYGLVPSRTNNEIIFAWGDMGAVKLHIPNKGASYITHPEPSNLEESVWTPHQLTAIERSTLSKRIEEFPILKGLQAFVKETESIVANADHKFSL